MDTQIKYTDEFGSVISEQQRETMVTYNKETLVDGNLKMEESLGLGRNKDYAHINYYLGAGEDKNTVIQNYCDRVKLISCTMHFNKVSVNGFNQWDWEDYHRDQSLKFKGIVTFDQNQRLIFLCDFDLVNDELMAGAVKYFYGNQFVNAYDDRLLEFRYDADGMVESIIDVHENYGYIKSITLSDFLKDTDFSLVQFPWDQHRYYHAVTPYLPTGAL
jgi:hypothetical protein